MPLWLFAMMAPVLGVSLNATHRLFSEVHDLERAWIAVDNASTLLGQGARTVLNTLEGHNRRVERADHLHHASHFCARVPATAAQCQAPDRAAEAWLSAQHHASWAAAEMVWVAAARAAKAQGLRVGLSLQLERPQRVPARAKRCSTCGVTVGWELSAPVQSVTVRWKGRTLCNRIQLRQGSSVGRTWQYRIEEEAGE